MVAAKKASAKYLQKQKAIPIRMTLFFWLGDEDSNLGSTIQSRMSYH